MISLRHTFAVLGGTSAFASLLNLVTGGQYSHGGQLRLVPVMIWVLCKQYWGTHSWVSVILISLKAVGSKA